MPCRQITEFLFPFPFFFVFLCVFSSPSHDSRSTPIHRYVRDLTCFSFHQLFPRTTTLAMGDGEEMDGQNLNRNGVCLAESRCFMFLPLPHETMKHLSSRKSEKSGKRRGKMKKLPKVWYPGWTMAPHVQSDATGYLVQSEFDTSPSISRDALGSSLRC